MTIITIRRNHIAPTDRYTRYCIGIRIVYGIPPGCVLASKRVRLKTNRNSGASLSWFYSSPRAIDISSHVRDEVILVVENSNVVLRFVGGRASGKRHLIIIQYSRLRWKLFNWFECICMVCAHTRSHTHVYKRPRTVFVNRQPCINIYSASVAAFDRYARHRQDCIKQNRVLRRVYVTATDIIVSGVGVSESWTNLWKPCELRTERKKVTYKYCGK